MSDAIFGCERDLQKAISAMRVGADPDYSTVLSRREVPVGGCIPDLVYVSFCQVPKATLWPRKWSFIHSYILWLLRSRDQMQPEEVAAACFQPLSGQMGRTVQDLVRSGAATCQADGRISLSPEMRAVDAHVTTVEAKIYRWREALAQAVSYQRFSDAVVVAMDANRVPLASDIHDRFRLADVGLCAVSGQAFEWLVRPTGRRSVSDADKEYLVSSAATRQTLWSLRYAKNAPSQART